MRQVINAILDIGVTGAPWRMLSKDYPQRVLRAEDQRGFVVLPRRWVVERTFAWLSQRPPEQRL